MQVTSTFNVQEEYKKYKNVLKKAEKGKVVTRFAPEPSGYLHIGHVKAALITYHYAKMYDGKMILRFDDTNPSKEKQEYVDSIQEDLQTLGLSWDKMSYSSDYFEMFEEQAIKFIKEGLAYVDNTPQEQMREERTAGIESANRNLSVEENLRIFNKMKTAYSPDELAKKIEESKKPQKYESKSKDAKKEELDVTNYASYCLRAKISMTNKNKCMRDPVLYRCNFTPHHRTGTKYRIYPTYDFACPILDSFEGVTHAMRSMEYTDRVDQYNWVIKKAEVRKVEIFEFSRLNFVNVVLSKRKLTWFVDQGRVEGWGDARMPTVRGIIRRGLRVETLTEFMLVQGPSRKPSLMEWDKIWAMNTKIIDPICPRFTALRQENICTLTLTNVDEGISYNQVPYSKDKKAVKQLTQMRPLGVSKNMYMDLDDAKLVKEGEKVTLINFGNVVIKSIKKQGNSLELVGESLPEDKDWKSTQKLNWLSKDQDLVTVNIIELDHLINADKIEEDQDILDVVNDNTKFVSTYFSDPLLRNCQVDDVFQFERRGFYRVDKIKNTKDGDKIIDVIFTPDGKSKAMTSTISHAVAADRLAGAGSGKADKKQAAKDQNKQDSKKQQQTQQKGSNLTLYTVIGGYRGVVIQAVADMVKEQLNVKNLTFAEMKSKEILALNPLGQIPFLQTPDGVLTQTSAIIRYLVQKQSKSTLYGANDFEKSEVDQWLNFANYEIVTAFKNSYYKVLGWVESSDKEYEVSVEQTKTLLKFVNDKLQSRQFLVGKAITLADINLFVYLAGPVRMTLSQEFIKEQKYLSAWLSNIGSNKIIAKYYRQTPMPAKTWFE